jgi:hypothetical protein
VSVRHTSPAPDMVNLIVKCSSDIAWLVAECDGTDARFAVWLPQPDVQSIINSDFKVPPLNAICSGVCGRLVIGRTLKAFDVDLLAVTMQGAAIALGRATLGSVETEAVIAR